MSNSRSLRPVAALLCSLVVAACANATSRVDVADATPQALASKGTGVAVMRLGAASWACAHVSMLIGQREGNAFRGVRGVRVANVRSVTDSAVAEVELPPGEYHFLAYRCLDRKGASKTVGDSSDTANVYRTSIARFTLQAGEVVNIGYLQYNASKTNRSMFGRPIRQDVSVSDWPLEELDRFKKNRPEIFARMTTRLMQVTMEEAPSATDCARLTALQQDGKVSALPPACQPKAVAKR